MNDKYILGVINMNRFLLRRSPFHLGFLIFAIVFLKGLPVFAFTGLDIYVFKPESLAYYLKVDENRINEIQEILHKPDYSNKIGPKLRLEIDSILSKKENYTFEGYVYLVHSMSVFDYALLSFPLLGISYCDMGADKVEANFLLSTIPMILTNPLIHKIGADSMDCEAISATLSQKQLGEAQELIDKNKIEIIEDLGLKSTSDRIDKSIETMLRDEKKLKAQKDTTIVVRFYLLDMWSDKMDMQFNQKGIKFRKKINDYVIESDAPLMKINEMLSSQSVAYVMMADTDCEEFFIDKKDKLKTIPITELVDD